MEQKALFIHGLHSDCDSTTGSYVAEILKNYGYETIHPTFDLMDCKGTITKIRKIIEEEKIRLVAAHSLGGFYGFVVPFESLKIIINPCLKPEIEIPPLLNADEKMPENLIQEWKAAWDRNIFDIEENAFMHGIFAKNDELFSYADFAKKELHFRHIHMIEGGHKPEKQQLEKAIEEAVKTPVQFSPAMAIPDINS